LASEFHPDDNGMTSLNSNIFKTVDPDRRGTTSEEVISQLREMIHRGELRSGDRLPPERDLAKLLGVSRPTLRAGIRSLAAVGILNRARVREHSSSRPMALPRLTVVHLD